MGGGGGSGDDGVARLIWRVVCYVQVEEGVNKSVWDGDMQRAMRSQHHHQSGSDGGSGGGSVLDDGLS
jgi:hypothetical protein